MWSDYCQEHSGALVWRGARYVNPREGLAEEALTAMGRNLENTLLEKEEMLRNISFSPNNGNQ